MQPRLFSILLSLALFAILPFPKTESATRVAIRAVASDQYLRKRAQDESKRIQTYQFIKGKRFGPSSVNKGMAQLSFDEITLDIAQRLAEQDH